eukprot:s2297_g4.t1
MPKSMTGAAYYVRVAKLMLAGSQEKPASDVLELNALGYAIPQATAVAVALEEERLGKVLSIRTGLQEVPSTSRHCPVMIIRIARSAEREPS